MMISQIALLRPDSVNLDLVYGTVFFHSGLIWYALRTAFAIKSTAIDAFKRI